MGDAIWTTERSFWLDGAANFRRHMSASALMVFPAPVGILRGEAILDGLEGVPRWVSVEMDDRAQACSGDTLVLAYRATARREGAEPYGALCSSTYVRSGGDWTLLAHQQTPI